MCEFGRGGTILCGYMGEKLEQVKFTFSHTSQFLDKRTRTTPANTVGDNFGSISKVPFCSVFLIRGITPIKTVIEAGGQTIIETVECTIEIFAGTSRDLPPPIKITAAEINRMAFTPPVIISFRSWNCAVSFFDLMHICILSS